MATDWEATLRSWVKPPSDYEDLKRDKTEEEIRQALRSSRPLSEHGFKVYTKGSYANNTNVRLDYDVDIAVECTDFYFHDETGAAADVKKAAVRTAIEEYRGGYTPSAFKNDVEQALIDYYGRAAVTRGNMALRVREKRTTLPADVVPCHEYRYIYDVDWYGRQVYHQGTRINPEIGPYVHNWSQQQLTNGVAKNDATGRRYKRMVRALKRLETYLVQKNLIESAPSFLMECLVYNVPNDHLNNSTYVADMRAVLARIFNATRTDSDCKDWVEASERKYLFHSSQLWNRNQAHALASAGWDTMGLS